MDEFTENRIADLQRQISDLQRKLWAQGGEIAILRGRLESLWKEREVRQGSHKRNRKSACPVQGIPDEPSEKPRRKEV